MRLLVVMEVVTATIAAAVMLMKPCLVRPRVPYALLLRVATALLAVVRLCGRPRAAVLPGIDAHVGRWRPRRTGPDVDRLEGWNRNARLK